VGVAREAFFASPLICVAVLVGPIRAGVRPSLLISQDREDGVQIIGYDDHEVQPVSHGWERGVERWRLPAGWEVTLASIYERAVAESLQWAVNTKRGRDRD